MRFLLALLLFAALIGAGLYFSGSSLNRISPDANMLQLGGFAYQEKRYEDAFNWYQHAANQGLSEGQFRLSELYQRGWGVEKDEQQAVHWLALAAKQGLAKAEYDYAIRLEHGRGIRTANAKTLAQWFKKSALQQHPEAMLKLAKLYEAGLGVEKSDSKALMWALKAEAKNAPNATTVHQLIIKNNLYKAKEGDASAQYLLATWFEDGRGVSKDQNKALRWYQKAAETGHAKAQYALAKALVASDGKQSSQALHWFEQAAQQGHQQAASAAVALLAMQNDVTITHAKEAWRWLYHGMQQGDATSQYNLATVLNQGLLGLQKSSLDLEPWLKSAAQAGLSPAQNDYAIYLKMIKSDSTQAVRWLHKAASSSAKAQFNLGFIYARGDGVTPDDEKAIHFWRLANKNGSRRAQMMLGLFYDLGRGVGRSEKQAVEWYQKAAQAGDENALYNLAVLFYNGRGIDRDYQRAAEYFKIIAQANNTDAQNIYGSLFLEEQGVTYAPKTAVTWFQRAADAGHIKAMFNLATQYRRGYGVAQDDKKALHWYEKAAKLEFAPAQNALAYMYAEGRGTKVDKDAAYMWFQKASAQGLSLARDNLISLEQHDVFSLIGLQVDNQLQADMLTNKSLDLSLWLEVHGQPIL
ncbi:MAG: tetratricopeptide repeat protein [Mariprofundaceae bacterium]|nr:tetratricopeptide repeat protein [Mariprofundaceae bacterium]